MWHRYRPFLATSRRFINILNQGAFGPNAKKLAWIRKKLKRILKPIYNLTYLLSKHKTSQNNQTPSIMNDKQTIKKHWKEYGWKNCLGPDTDVHVLANQENSSKTVDGSLSLEQTDYVTNWHQRHQFILLRINSVILHAEISTSIRKRSLSVTTGATALLPLPP